MGVDDTEGVEEFVNNKREITECPKEELLLDEEYSIPGRPYGGYCSETAKVGALVSDTVIVSIRYRTINSN